MRKRLASNRLPRLRLNLDLFLNAAGLATGGVAGDVAAPENAAFVSKSFQYKGSAALTPVVSLCNFPASY